MFLRTVTTHPALLASQRNNLFLRGRLRISAPYIWRNQHPKYIYTYKSGGDVKSKPTEPLTVTTMSSPSTLTEWTQSQFSSLFKPSENQLQEVSVFAADAQVMVNHTQVSVEQFKKSLADKFGAGIVQDVNIDWKELIHDDESGIVAGFVDVTRSMKFRIRVGPAQIHTYISVSMKIAQDGDQRAVSQMFYTSVDKAAELHLV
ncbi:uncharacterized protein EV420DRAFT_1573820 [Desarmillaria tabescens]|uniref:Uncharacterized protein n=1 Tax=Armillaria tabescens TaxID=1929756 RepID=A0AA39MSX2_ARMTA|nr:uncharacterized protein EV420DRAFT_1573820 [Desarmillaria tabescens]KAK0444605.1 hypothetical protein EV420DRAFT_1573820 [Desarmillaria tabescens]